MYRDVEPLMDAPLDPRTPPEARQRVAALFQDHALGLVKLAKVMLGDQSAAEDVVQDAFLGLYRRWPLGDEDRALGYLRASVLNGCRTAHRGRTRRDRALRLAGKAGDVVSAEESATSRGRAALARMLKEEQ
jgi:DNA-directed RNA polymerase specialized sigma24 family protein